MTAQAQPMNLDSRAQATQLRVGVVALAVALTVGALLAKTSIPAGYRAFAFLPFFFAAYGLLAALYRTCGFTAIRGRRLTNQGSERVIDPDALRAQRRLGTRIIMGSAALASAVTALLIVAT
jgi:hypothetical protein